MRIHVTRPLFAWDALEDSPSLLTVRRFLESVPDAGILNVLRQMRGRGRNDYPVHVLWGVCLLTVMLRHTSVQSCLDELHRNVELRRLIGIQHEYEIPQKWNMSRFMKTLGSEPCLTALRECFDQMIARMGDVIPELGVETVGDASHLSGRPGRAEQGAEGSALPQPSGGRKEYSDEDGNVTKVVEWFGYKFHIIVDRRHEVVLGWQISSTDTADSEVLPELVSEAQGNLPEGRIKSLAYDKAADTKDVHRVLEEAGISPVIEIRSMWQDEPERMLPGHDGTSNVVYDEAGTVYCYDKTSDPPVRHRMYYDGYEPGRGTLKYRCPARAEGWTCPYDQVCNKGLKYGKTVRVHREIDLRRFPPIPRATKKFERLYKGRTAVERVIARLKVFWGADDGNITGPERFHGYLATIMIVHAGMATLLASAPRWEGTLGQTRLGTIAKALRDKLSGKMSGNARSD